VSGVILRCPQCGTTAASPGECGACHEAAVRYHCTNHAPGRWLASPTCPDCGAVFGVAPRATAAPVQDRSSRVEAEPVDDPSPVTRRRPRRTSGPPSGMEPWGRRAEPPDDGVRDAHAEMAAAHRRLEELLGRGASRRDGAASGRADGPAPRVVGLGGCLVRLVVMLLLLFLLMFAAPLMFGLSMLQMLRF
jgi:hypothetical protein